MTIEVIENFEIKRKVALKILKNLYEWFGKEESLLNYVDNLEGKKFYLLNLEKENIGFFSIKRNNKYTAELYVNGILEEYHNRGYGKMVMKKIVEDLKEEGYKLLMVKTIGESLVDEAYSKTRKFYRSVGFLPLEEIKEIWGEDNPCLIMVKNI